MIIFINGMISKGCQADELRTCTKKKNNQKKKNQKEKNRYAMYHCGLHDNSLLSMHNMKVKQKNIKNN